MCGIAGIVRWGARPENGREIEAMTRAVAHRGPDGEGFFRREGVALGHRRLSIIDLEGGKQPMSNEDGNVWVTFNGEIYNYAELREELTAKGHRFATRSDTEVLVHAWEQWGEDCLHRLRGMFAFALVDFDRRELFLARDHFGIKPLVYRRGRDYLAFASELAALRNVEDETPGGRLDAVDHYLRFRYIPSPATIYREIFQLPPGFFVRASLDGRVGEPVRYWSMCFQPVAGKSDDEWRAEFDSVVTASVEAHLVADVPFGVFLSGGIDSTLVASKMADLLGRPVQAFSIGFDESDYSELDYARRAAATLGVELIHEVLAPDAAHLLPELVAHYGQPYADTSMIPTWYVARLARQHVPMVLSGDGGDEVFAGYARYAMMEGLPFARELAALIRSPRGVLWRTPLVIGAMRSLSAARQARYQVLCGVFLRPEREQLWLREHRHHSRASCPAFDEAARRACNREGITYSQLMDFQTYLPDDILTKVDVASMCHGLEVRTPLVDRRVADFARSLPLAVRSRPSRGGRIAKWISKEALRQKFDEKFINRQKMGFGIPEDRWLRRGTVVRELFDDLVTAEHSRLREWFDLDELRRRVARFDGAGHGGTPLWLLLILALWREQNPHVSFS
ncbi:MAG TPA: asparagine synthase (glutamine-hydrolyzing) [Pirellulales bacterium]|nr:asparagine synthase (glutamine-hydrolyzing) [Pirellulales bacterium]